MQLTTGKAFLDYYNIDHSVTRQYDIESDEESEMCIIHLTQSEKDTAEDTSKDGEKVIK